MSVRGFNTGSGVEQYDYEYLDNKPEIPTKKSDIRLGNVDNTSDLDKPISTAMQTALNEKVPNTRKVNGKALSADVSITSEDIGYDASTAYGSGTVGKELTELNRQISEKADVIIDSASGSIASFADGADDMPIKSLVVNIEPVQSGSGDPSPTNVRPISGHTGASVKRTGKNLLDNEHATVYNRYIQYYDTNNANWVESSDSASYCIFVKPNTSYAIKAHGETTVFRVCAISVDPSTIGSNTIHSTNAYSANAGTYKYCVITTGSTETWLVVQLGKMVAENRTGMVMVELGNTYSAYEPYTGNQISVTFPTEAGTVYGGTLDVTNGVLTVDKAMDTFDGSADENWVFVSSSRRYAKAPLTNYFKYQESASLPPFTSNMAVPLAQDATYGNITYSAVSAAISELNVVRYVYAGVTDTLTIDEFRTWLSNNNLQVLYSLATSITIQLTAEQISGILTTLYGTNNIWTDVGTVDVEYPADTKLYIEQLTKPTEDDMTANANIAANKFFMIGNTLYFSTAAIAAGATIIPGTNCNVVSLADALNNLIS